MSEAKPRQADSYSSTSVADDPLSRRGDALPVALVTGGARGIGAAIARDLGRDHHVLVGARTREHAERLAAELPSASPFVADLCDPIALSEAAAQVERLDVLVHSAGIAPAVPGEIACVPRELWQQVLEINVVAVADLTRMLLPQLRAARGLLVTINSGAGLFRPGAGGGVYAASKYALRAFTDALREEERGQVRVTSIYPGRVDTDMQVELQAARGRPYNAGEHLRPSSIAQAVRLAVDASPDAMVEDISVRPVVGRI